jgi:hypothetical protein
MRVFPIETVDKKTAKKLKTRNLVFMCLPPFISLGFGSARQVKKAVYFHKVFMRNGAP